MRRATLTAVPRFLGFTNTAFALGVLVVPTVLGCTFDTEGESAGQNSGVGDEDDGTPAETSTSTTAGTVTSAATTSASTSTETTTSTSSTASSTTTTTTDPSTTADAETTSGNTSSDTEDTDGETGGIPDSIGPFGDVQVVDLGVTGTAGVDDPTLTADMLEIYFGLLRENELEVIHRSTRPSVGSPWEFDPTPVFTPPEFVRDTTPELSADGLVIAISRGTSSADSDLLLATRNSRDANWSALEPLEGLVNPNGGRRIRPVSSKR